MQNHLLSFKNRQVHALIELHTSYQNEIFSCTFRAFNSGNENHETLVFGGFLHEKLSQQSGNEKRAKQNYPQKKIKDTAGLVVYKRSYPTSNNPEN